MERFGVKKAFGTADTTVDKLPVRRLGAWHEGFFEYTDRLPSPPLFRTWAAIAIIAGALERKTWVRSHGSNLYPNLYTILVAPPGVGKTVLTSQAFRFWSELSDHHLASSSVTSASLLDELYAAERRLIRPREIPSIVSFNSLLISSDELGVLLPKWENDFMNRLTALYDCHPFSESRRGRDTTIQIKSPQLNLLAGTTPSYLNNVMPEGAWDQGFISRVIMIYSGQTTLRALFDEEVIGEESQLFKDLVHDLKIIGQLYGKMEFTPEAAKAITAWHMAGGPPKPDHPRLLHYSTRRSAHLIKLCQVACASVSDDLQITVEHYQQAMDWLLEAEFLMADIFKSMAVGGDSRAMDELWHFAYLEWVKHKRPITEVRAVQFLSERVPAHSVGRILEVMVRAGIFKERIESVGKCFEPKPRKP